MTLSMAVSHTQPLAAYFLFLTYVFAASQKLFFPSLANFFIFHFSKLIGNCCEKIKFGAAIHDIGKSIHKNELSNPGNKHENDGYDLLIKMGITDEYAKYAKIHSKWNENSEIEDLIVSLADKIWKGQRNQELEDLLVNKVSNLINKEHWEIFLIMDNIIQEIAEDADKRLKWQNQFTI